MSKAYIPPVALVAAAGIGMVNCRLTAPLLSGEAARAAVPSSSSAEATAAVRAESRKRFRGKPHKNPLLQSIASSRCELLS
jgi:hypothetical protein